MHNEDFGIRAGSIVGVQRRSIYANLVWNIDRAVKRYIGFGPAAAIDGQMAAVIRNRHGCAGTQVDIIHAVERARNGVHTPVGWKVNRSSDSA